MRIGIDYTAAVRQGGGIGRYTRNLVQALAEHDPENTYTLLVAGGQSGGDGPGSWPPNFRVRSLPLSDRWLHIVWQRLRIPLRAQTVMGPLDLFHSPDFVLPPTGRTPRILTVHDLSFLRLPQCYIPSFQRYLQRAVGRAVARAAHILADSESTRGDLIELMQVQPGRVSVVYPGVERRFRPLHDADALQRVRERYELPERFVLGLGTLQPRKNFAGLIESFGCLLRHAGEESRLADLHLVIAGAKGWLYEDAFAAVAQGGLEDRVYFAGFVDDRDLPPLYNLALVFAFPSWYEGFGLPALEAMACGTPVVVADNSSLPEVVGDAALLVDSADRGELADALQRLVLDRALRTRLSASGLQQAQRFNWAEAARQVLQIYDTVSETSGARL